MLRRRETVRREVWDAAYGIAASILLLLLDPFNLSRGMAYAGELFGHHIAAAAKPASVAGDRMLVVVAADDFLMPRSPVEQPVSWPLAWPIWAEAVAAAADAGARVVMLDVVLIDDRPPADIARVVDVLDRASRKSLILLATAPSGSLAFRRIHPALLALSRRNPRIRLVSVLRARTAGPFETYAARPDGAMPSAGVAVARALCGQQPHYSEFCAGKAAPAAMELQWRRPPAQNCGYDRPSDEVAAGCKGLWGGSAGRLLGIMLAGTFNGVLRDGAIPIAPLAFRNYPLPYASLRQLLSGLTGNEARAARGGAVLIGQNFASAEDSAATPVYGDVPGVFLHGVAADDLLTPGGTWIAGTPKLFAALPDGWTDAAYAALYVLCAIPFILVCRLAVLLLGGGGIAVGAAGAAAGLLALVAVTFVDVGLLRRGPSTWFVVFGVLALSSLTAEAIAHLVGMIGARRRRRRRGQ